MVEHPLGELRQKLRAGERIRLANGEELFYMSNEDRPWRIGANRDDRVGRVISSSRVSILLQRLVEKQAEEEMESWIKGEGT